MIGDLASRVVIHFEGETKDLKRSIKDLQGAEREYAEQQHKNAEARNKQLDGFIKGMGTATVAIGAAAAAGAAMWAGMEHNARKAQLAINTAGLDVAKLTKGFGGLRSQMQSLETANDLAKSKFKLTGEQMETVGKAIRQLVREGADWEDATKKVTEAIVKLDTGGLKALGLHVREAKTDTEKFNAIMEVTAAKAGLLGDNTKTAAEELVGLKTRFSDVMDSVKQSLGEIGVAFLPIVESLAKIAGFAASLVNLLPGGASTVGKAIKYTLPVYGQYNIVKDLLFGDEGKLRGMRQQVPTGHAHPDVGAFDLELESVKSLRKPGPYVKPTMPGYTIGGGFASTSFGGAYGDYDQGFDDISSGLSFDHSGLGGQGANYGYLEGADAKFKYQQAMTARNESKLEGIFGPLSEFDAYKTAFETLNGAVGSAFSAWIDGSASAGAAFKKFIGEALKGVAVQMAMESVKHAAYAIGNLAFGNLAGAATHGKAAAAFAAGAVVVGAAAKSLHGGGASAGGAGAGAPGGGVPAYSGGGSSGGGSTTTVIAYGTDYSQDSARQRMLRASKVLDDAKSAGNGAISYA